MSFMVFMSFCSRNNASIFKFRTVFSKFTHFHFTVVKVLWFTKILQVYMNETTKLPHLMSDNSSNQIMQWCPKYLQTMNNIWSCKYSYVMALKYGCFKPWCKCLYPSVKGHGKQNLPTWIHRTKTTRVSSIGSDQDKKLGLKVERVEV